MTKGIMSDVKNDSASLKLKIEMACSGVGDGRFYPTTLDTPERSALTTTIHTRKCIHCRTLEEEGGGKEGVEVLKVLGYARHIVLDCFAAILVHLAEKLLVFLS